MSDSLFNDIAMRAAKSALDGLSLRQQVIGRNLANVDTPGYRAQRVQFEDALKRALQPKASVPLEITHAAHLASPTAIDRATVSNRPGGTFRADMNNVDIDVELTEMSVAGISYEAISLAVSKKLQLLKTIAMSR